MRAFGVAGGCAVAVVMVAAGCGSGSTTRTEPAGSVSESAAPASSSSATGISGQRICDAVKVSDVEAAIGGRSAPPKPVEPKKGFHACVWKAADESRAVVALVLDDSFDKNFLHKPVDFINGFAETFFPTATDVSVDVGARNVTVYGLGSASDRVPYAKLSVIANTVNDLIVDADRVS